MESASTAIPSRQDGGPAPLSFAQERLWFLCRMRPESPVFHIPAAFRLAGPLDRPRLTEALEALTRRHAALRTRFVVTADGPAQEVLGDVRPILDVDDLAAAPAAEREEQALRRAVEHARRPFDLEAAPLCRFHLLRLGPAEHLLVVTIHHIVAEVQSLGLLARDLCVLYARAGGAAAPELAELSLDFGDFAAWQRAQLAEGGEQSLAYWRERLAGELPTLELATDHPRPAVQSFEGGTRTRRLPRTLARRLRAHARDTGQTLFAPLLAAYAAMLSRYGATRDVLIGVPLTDRDRAELEGLVGFFVNTLVLRCDLSGDVGFQALEDRLAGELLGARSHQDVPFERLVEALAPGRDLSRTPLFQVAFLLQYATEGGGQLPPLGDGLTMAALDDPLAVHTATSKFDLALVALVADEDVTLAFEYSTALFEPATVDRMLAHVERLLAEGLAAPERPVASLSILTDEERGLLLDTWNATAAPLPEGTCVHRLFEEQARATPGALAVKDGATELTYGELDARANRLAHRLRELGVGADVPVGICTERTPEMVVGILAALKAGGAYLPLDLSYPADRLAFMLQDAGAPVVLSRAPLRELLPEHSGVTLLLDEEEAALAARPATPPALAAAPGNLAYVIYTSGSTGVPKGVEVEHTGLLNLLTWHRRAYDVGPADRATHLAGLAFDASVWELWPYLTAGASLHLVPEDVRLSPADLIAWLAAERITLSFLPTPLAEAVLREPVPEGLALRAMLTGGDKLRAAPEAPLPYALVNHYGPTENSVVATACEVLPGSPGAPPIGHPIDNVRVHLLDGAGQYVPIGVPGELCIAGKSLARGYRHRPELTAEKFVPDPQGREERLYATGDMARWLPDGEIEFLGRQDGQVKVRGFRIELGEIEALLAQHPSVRECACALHARNGDDGMLAAYVVPREESTDDELRGFLRERLPDYMCPAAFVRLDELPLTPNGKIDRRALPEPTDLGPPRAFVAPEGRLQTQIAGVWSEVLQRDEIDAHANFFEVGGHSLLMAQVHVRLQERLGRDLTVVELFQYPSVSSLAAHLEEAKDGPEAAAEGLDRAASRLARMKRRRSRQVER